LSFLDSPFARESTVTWIELIKVPVAPFRRSLVTHQRKSGRNLRPLFFVAEQAPLRACALRRFYGVWFSSVA